MPSSIVDAFIDGKQWRFYGNGLDKNLEKSMEKACLETLQFIPGFCSNAWQKLSQSENPNDRRIYAWSSHPTISVCDQHKGSNFTSISFHEKIEQAFKFVSLKCQTIELTMKPKIFVSYVSFDKDWRTEYGVPIV